MSQLTKKELQEASNSFLNEYQDNIESNKQLTAKELITSVKQVWTLENENVGLLDIEASNLSADFGYVFSYAIKKLDGKIYGRVLKGQEIKKFIFDERLMQEVCTDMRKFDRIITHYGTDHKFDIPYLRTRAMKYGIDFPMYKSIWVEDTFVMSRNKLRLSRNRLENLCVFFGIEAKGHKLNPPIWQRAMAGHEESLKYIWQHNIEDVISLEELWKKIFKYVNHGKTGI